MDAFLNLLEQGLNLFLAFVDLVGKLKYTFFELLMEKYLLLQVLLGFL